MHANGSTERLKPPHPTEIQDEFTAKLNEIAYARRALLAIRSDVSSHIQHPDPIDPASRGPTGIPNATAPTSIATPTQPTATTHHTSSASAKHNYSLLIPVRTITSAIGANAIRNEIQEHILCRAGYVPLNALTNESIQNFAANPAALKLELKPARTTHGTLEKRWTPVLTDLVTSETRLTRSLWAEAVKNLLELLALHWGSNHELTLMWKSYFDTLLAHKLFRSENDFSSILKFDIKSRNLWWTHSDTVKLAPDILEDLTATHHDELEQRLRNITSTLSAQHHNQPYRPFQHPISNFPLRSRMPHTHNVKPYDRPSPANRSFRPNDRGTAACLICARTNHKASDCRDSKTTVGSPTVTEFNNNQLRGKTDKRPICFNFNIGRAENSSISRSHTDQGIHRCSLCLGSHGAHVCTQRY